MVPDGCRLDESCTGREESAVQRSGVRSQAGTTWGTAKPPVFTTVSHSHCGSTPPQPEYIEERGKGLFGDRIDHKKRIKNTFKIKKSTIQHQ